MTTHDTHRCVNMKLQEELHRGTRRHTGYATWGDQHRHKGRCCSLRVEGTGVMATVLPEEATEDAQPTTGVTAKKENARDWTENGKNCRDRKCWMLDRQREKLQNTRGHNLQ